MDFRFNDAQTTVAKLARGILEKEVSAERLKAAETSSDWFDATLWSTLARAGLLGIAVPQEYGGMGFGILELFVLLYELGRVVAPLPLLPTLVLGGLPIARLGTPEQKKTWLLPMAEGRALLTACLPTLGSRPELSPPAVTATQEGSSYLIEGRIEAVAAAHIADCMLLPCRAEHETAVFLLDPHSKGVSITTASSSSGEPLSSVALSAVRAPASSLLGGRPMTGNEQLCWIQDCALAALGAVQLGVCERALELTAAHVREREQFGVAIGSFQAVQHRCADALIDLDAMRWTTWRAAWKLAQGLPARSETMVAKFWAAEAGSRIAHSAQHLHGGLGVDLEYPLHRYFLWAKRIELWLGGAGQQLAHLGGRIAAGCLQERA